MSIQFVPLPLPLKGGATRMDAPQEPKQMSFVASFFYIMMWMVGVAVGWPITLLIRRWRWLQIMLVVAIGCGGAFVAYTKDNDFRLTEQARQDAKVAVVVKQNKAITARNDAAKHDWPPVEATFSRLVTDNNSGYLVPLFSFDDPVTNTVQSVTLTDVSGVSIDETGAMHHFLWVSRERAEDGSGFTYYTSEPSWLWSEPQKALPVAEVPSDFSPFWAAYFILFGYYWLMKWLFWSADQARGARAANLAMRAAKQASQT